MNNTSNTGNNVHVSQHDTLWHASSTTSVHDSSNGIWSRWYIFNWISCSEFFYFILMMNSQTQLFGFFNLCFFQFVKSDHMFQVLTLWSNLHGWFEFICA